VCAGTEYEEGHPSKPEEAGHDDSHGESLTEQPGRQSRRYEWLDRTERGGDAAGKSVGGCEQQREEAADVEDSESEGLRPPHPDGPVASAGGKHQACRKGTHRAGEQWSTGRQQFRGDDVCHAPRGRCQRSGEQQARIAAVVIHR
jgi:hypothetical protein